MTGKQAVPLPVIDCRRKRPRLKWHKIKENISGKIITWNKKKYSDIKKVLYLTHKQKRGDETTSQEILDILKNKNVANACVIDWLNKNRDEIPEEWEGVGRIYFWGTIYYDTEDGDLSVRCMEYNKDNQDWIFEYSSLKDWYWDNKDYALLII